VELAAKIILVGFYAICSIALLAYGIQCYVLTYLFLRRRKARLNYHRGKFSFFDSVTNPTDYPRVVTQIPMFNEKAVAVRVINAVCSMDYPRSRHTVQVLDDSTDRTSEYINQAVSYWKERGIDVAVIHRDERTGFKAGALQNGLTLCDAEFVAIFDADFIPQTDFLKKAIPFFLDRPELGLVQGRWAHINPTASLLTRGQALGIDGHFMVEQAARSWNGLFMNFNGTAGVFRRRAIEQAGGWHHDTLTEDMDLSYRMQLAGYEAEYVPDIAVPAEIPEDINAFKNQQFRWAKGSIQTAKKILPLLKLQSIGWFKYLQAFFHLTHYAVHPLMVTLAVLTMPVLFFVKVSFSPLVFGVVLGVMLLSTMGPSVMYLVSQHFLGNKARKKVFLIPALMVLGTGLAINNGKAVIQALSGKQTPFHRTPKKGELASKTATYRPLKDSTSFFELAIGMYCLVSVYLFFGFDTFIISPFLMLYSSGFLFVGLISLLHLYKPSLIDAKFFGAHPAEGQQSADAESGVQ